MITTFTISIENPELLKEWYHMKEDYQREAKALFLQTVFQIHKYLIRISPLDTGEIRGGWTGILNKYNIDYSAQLFDKSLYDTWKQENKTPEGRTYHDAMAQVMKGAAQSHFEDKPLDITIYNEVPHAIYLEDGTSKIQGRHTTEFVKYKGEYYFNEIFNQWFESLNKAGKIVPIRPEKMKQLTN